MKLTSLALAFTLLGSAAQADLLARWEVAEEAISQQVFTLFGNPAAFTPWTDEVRSGKACLLSGIMDMFSARKVEGYVRHLEATAARRMSYTDGVELSMEWARATTANRMWIEDLAPLAQTCGQGF